jgi:capsular polysaccharide biosynthesis protein
MLKVDREARLPFPLKPQPDQLEQYADYRGYYTELAIRTLLSVRRQWLLLATFIALGILLALLIIPLIPRKYSATAFIFPSLYSQDQGKIVALATVDATSIVNGEARLVLSDTILQAVVKRLDPGLPTTPGSGSSWLRDMFFPETRIASRFDRETSALRNRVEVSKDTRSYLIGISFTASSAEKAAEVANAVAIEYIRDKWIQRSREAVIAAEVELVRQRAVNGDRHPKIVQAIETLEAARAELRSSMVSEEGRRDSVKADEGIKLALPNHTPTSPKGMMILGLSCFFGLLAGIGLAVWRDQRGLQPVDLAFGRHLLARMRNGSATLAFKMRRPFKGEQQSYLPKKKSIAAPGPASPPPD